MIDDDGWVQDAYYDNQRSPHDEDEEQERELREQFHTGENDE